MIFKITCPLQNGVVPTVPVPKSPVESALKAASYCINRFPALPFPLYFSSFRPLKFSICGNHFFSIERASSFFFPAFITLIPFSVFSMAAAYLDNDIACLNSWVGICLRPVCRELSPRSKSGNAFTMQE